MATQEFYVRQKSESDARGPFNREQLAAQAAGGQLTPDTLFYDMDREQWAAIADNPELRDALFPATPKPELPHTRPGAADHDKSDAAPTRSVGGSLAADEGLIPDTRTALLSAGIRRAAALARWGCVVILLLAAVAELTPSADFLHAFTFGGLKSHPVAVLGMVDVLLALLLLFGWVGAYALVRLRAALGLGFLGFIYYVQGHPWLLLAVAAGSIGLFFSTIPRRGGWAWVWVVLGVAGMTALIWPHFVTS